MTDLQRNPSPPPISGLKVEPLADDQIITPGFQFPVGACFLIGGSGFSVGIVNHLGQTIGASRSFPWSDIGVVAGHSLPNDQVIDALFTRLFSVTKDLLGANEGYRLALLGVSFAGPLTGTGDQIMAHGTNMGVTFERPLKQYLHTHAERAGFMDIPLSDMQLINDAAAGAYGELYAENGASRGAEDLIYLILGTGVGGARVVKGKVDANFTEAGHTLLRSPTGEYAICTMADLEAKGLFRNGTFQTPTDGWSYLEHRIGGPWVAVRFAKFLMESMDEVDSALQKLESFVRPDGCPDFSRADIERVAALDESDVANWNRMVDKSVERALNMLLRFHSSLSRNSSAPEFSQYAFQFENMLNSEIGAALSVLSAAYPNAEIVLGSSLAEVRRENGDFLDMLYISTNGKAQVSQLATGTEREAASLTRSLQNLFF